MQYFSYFSDQKTVKVWKLIHLGKKSHKIVGYSVTSKCKELVMKYMKLKLYKKNLSNFMAISGQLHVYGQDM